MTDSITISPLQFYRRSKVCLCSTVKIESPSPKGTLGGCFHLCCCSSCHTRRALQCVLASPLLAFCSSCMYTLEMLSRFENISSTKLQYWSGICGSKSTKFKCFKKWNKTCQFSCQNASAVRPFLAFCKGLSNLHNHHNVSEFWHLFSNCHFCNKKDEKKLALKKVFKEFLV